MPLLEIDKVTKRFGGIVALENVTLWAKAGEIVGLIGPNGAGKTTALNIITRLYTPGRRRRALRRESTTTPSFRFPLRR